MDKHCRECAAGRAQCAQMDMAFRCPTHGVVRVGLALASERDLWKRRAEALLAAMESLAGDNGLEWPIVCGILCPSVKHANDGDEWPHHPLCVQARAAIALCKESEASR